MARDQRETTGRDGGPAAATPRLKAVACLGGVSLERGVPTAEIHDYIQETRERRLGGRAGPGAVGAGHADRRVRPPPAGAGGRAHGQRRPKVDEYQGLLAAGHLRGRPRRGRQGACGPPRWTCSSAGISWSPSTGAVSPRSRRRWRAGRAAGRCSARGSASSSTRCMDAIIDSFAPFLADIEEEIEETEFAVFTRSDEESVRSLLRLKRTLASLRRELYPLRAIFQVLLRRDHPFFPGSTERVPPRGVRPPPADPGHAGRRSARWRPPRWTHRWRSARTGSTRR